MSSEVAISVRDVSKVYRIYDRPEHRLVQMATLGRVRRFREFAALHDVSLEVRRGETVGIVGRNGCGKSTLLQIICGTLQPSAGSVSVNGRVAALLELGAGFNNEFTGRENVYMNGAILGFSREEMDARFDAIAEFAGIGEFIERPVKTYSSGMYVRLAFAVATAVEPDILIVDEALAVGDEGFQRKCFARIESIKERGGTILFVSHGAQTVVQFCDRAVLLDAGEKLVEGPPKDVVSQYQRLINLTGEAAAKVRQQIKGRAEQEQEPQSTIKDAVAVVPARPFVDASSYDPGLVSQSVVEYPSHGARISDIEIIDRSGDVANVLVRRQRYTLRYRVSFDDEADDVRFGFQVVTVSGLAIYGTGTGPEMRRKPLSHADKGSTWVIEFEWDCVLGPGTYFITAGVGARSRSGDVIYLHRLVDALPFRVEPGHLDYAGFVDLSVDARFSEVRGTRAGPRREASR